MHKLMSAFSAVGATEAIRVPKEATTVNVRAQMTSLGATKISLVDLVWQGAPRLTNDDNGVITSPELHIGTTAERVANNAFHYRINGVNYSKAAVAAGSVLSAAHAITASKHGGFNVYINAAGTISTKQPGATQTTTQTYTTAAQVHTALDALTTDPGKIYIGRVYIVNDGSAWTGNTDDLTDASDVTTATFISAAPVFTNVDSYQFDATDLVNQVATFDIKNTGERYGRLYLRGLTGTGTVTCHVSFR